MKPILCKTTVEETLLGDKDKDEIGPQKSPPIFAQFISVGDVLGVETEKCAFLFEVTIKRLTERTTKRDGDKRYSYDRSIGRKTPLPFTMNML